MEKARVNYTGFFILYQTTYTNIMNVLKFRRTSADSARRIQKAAELISEKVWALIVTIPQIT
ncbi:hypothetical protein DMB45_10315 [Sanguibacteroides justesenii]|nr:hypothetical protein DMB45_10315 [Sanguibacteroides justesenii]